MTEFRNYWDSVNVTKILAAIARGANYSQEISEKVSMSQSLVHSYIRQLRNQKILVYGETHGIIQTYKIDFDHFWTVIKNIITYERTGYGPKVISKLDKLVRENMNEFSYFIAALLDFYWDETLYEIFTNRLLEILYFRKNQNILAFNENVPDLKEANEIGAAPPQTFLVGFGKINKLNEMLDMLTDVYEEHDPPFLKAYRYIFSEGYGFYSNFQTDKKTR